MIRFFGPADKLPHPSELVGKIVGKAGKMVFLTYGGPHLVTGCKKESLVTKFFRRDDEKIEDAWSRPSCDWSVDDTIRLSQVAYVCDTVEEARAIYDASLESGRTHRRVNAALKAEINGLFSAIGTFEGEAAADQTEPTDEDGFYDSSLSRSKP